MATRRILLVEDDKDLSTLLLHVLVTAGFDVDLVRTVAEAQERLTGSAYELLTETASISLIEPPVSV